jgi:small GTP-binding protein
MATFEELLKKFPLEVQGGLQAIWDSLSPAEKTEWLKLLDGIPSEANLVKLLIHLSATQLKQAFGQKSRVAIVGPANVGKSTLYNQFVHTKDDTAKVSPLPGTTRVNQEADAGLFAVIDTPGADAVGEVGENEKEQALLAAREADFLIILFDAIQGIKKTEKEIFDELKDLGKPYVVALNKVDLVKGDQDGVMRLVTTNLGLEPGQVIPVTAKSGKNIDQLLISIAVAEPAIVAALGSALPDFRWKLAWRSIVSAASISAAIALAPLPVLDFGPLLVNQSVMVLGIARIYNYKINLERARELAVTFGMGFLGRTIFQEISKLGGIPGWILSAAIAASTTVVMGYAAAAWFEKGERLSTDALSKLTRKVTDELLESFKSLGKKKPSREKLQEAVSKSLNEITIESAPLRDEIE